jgi:hypothetical protein
LAAERGDVAVLAERVRRKFLVLNLCFLQRENVRLLALEPLQDVGQPDP